MRKPLDQLSEVDFEKARDALNKTAKFVGEMSKETPGPGWEFVFDKLEEGRRQWHDEQVRRSKLKP